MWQMPSELAAKVEAAERMLQVRIETADDAYPLFRAAIPIAKDYEGFFVLPIDKERHPICKPKNGANAALDVAKRKIENVVETQ